LILEHIQSQIKKPRIQSGAKPVNFLFLVNILKVQDVQNDRINALFLKSLFPRISRMSFIEITLSTEAT